jgi:hypothetical protein
MVLLLGSIFLSLLLLFRFFFLLFLFLLILFSLLFLLFLLFACFLQGLALFPSLFLLLLDRLTALTGLQPTHVNFDDIEVKVKIFLVTLHILDVSNLHNTRGIIGKLLIFHVVDKVLSSLAELLFFPGGEPLSDVPDDMLTVIALVTFLNEPAHFHP